MMFGILKPYPSPLITGRAIDLDFPLPGQLPTLRDWSDHMTTAFPEVRLKKYLEMRGADAGPWSRLCANWPA